MVDSIFLHICFDLCTGPLSLLMTFGIPCMEKIFSSFGMIPLADVEWFLPQESENMHL